ncbi:hypothetical protein A5886_002864 [Enterococcus sp. 8G7_MSG3316]|uniref:AAA+ ATPase domain-containing protein n=1 Tax=Candidatus Enterococcus testudinis TaxID=1834191 RepID=A0A242AAX7_9ENTE|nr:competence type IV pilus ATPase ComGA [Enterococcus sp. 8G7_MSG3316]OTN77763.1 hypothetical protein A5886_002864 [Enterococcus sp. 8G7_MSG3316]
MDIETFSDALVAHARSACIQDVSVLPQTDKMVVICSKSYQRQLYAHLSEEEAQKLITRFKFLGGMDVGERRKAQLGAVSYPMPKGYQRIRVSTVGDYQGRESLVLRFLYRIDQQHINYFFAEDVQLILSATRYRGLYLFAGPTGSGKSTLMYRIANQAQGQVITIEDPVEIEAPQFLQLQTNLKINQDYDELIRLSLRHHPELLIIGEIRNRETAQAAVRAALTGHRVFATIHARGVEETSARLSELLGETTSLHHALQGVVYQRLLPDAKGEVRGAMAYSFVDAQCTSTWQQTLTQIYEKGWITDDIFQKEGGQIVAADS